MSVKQKCRLERLRAAHVTVKKFTSLNQADMCRNMFVFCLSESKKVDSCSMCQLHAVYSENPALTPFSWFNNNHFGWRKKSRFLWTQQSFRERLWHREPVIGKRWSRAVIAAAGLSKLAIHSHSDTWTTWVICLWKSSQPLDWSTFEQFMPLLFKERQFIKSAYNTSHMQIRSRATVSVQSELSSNLQNVIDSQKYYGRVLFF